MILNVLEQIQRSRQTLPFSNVLYNWSLRGCPPERLIVKPVDPWPGDVQTGSLLCEGAFIMEGDRLDLYGNFWEPFGVSQAWIDHMHGFTWLRDLRAFNQNGGAERARNQAQAMIADWIRSYQGWNKATWCPDLTGERIALWISHYDFFGAPSSDDFQDLFFESLGRQSLHLSRSIPGSLSGVALLKAAKGLLYAGLAFEGRESWIEQSLGIFESEINKQILGDGCHASHSPSILLNTLQIFLDVRMALAAGGYPLPEKIQHAIDRMGPALRFFRYSDKKFALFHGTQEGHPDFIDCVLAQTGTKSKTIESLPCAGYERISLGRTVLMFNGGKPPETTFDTQAHAAPLAFEMCYGKERVFVNCGSHPFSPEWQDSLRATAAHNTLGIDYRNACEIRSNGHFGRKAERVSMIRENSKKACLIDASHDGYIRLNGITHRRRIYLSEQGDDLRGEDTLSAEISPDQPLDTVLRFHLHPRVLISLICDGREALLRLPSGSGWRFRHSGGYLALEDSIYLGEGCQPRKTKQLAIYGQISEKTNKFQWGLQREGS